MLAFAVRNNNSRQVQTAEQSCEYRLTIKYHISITKYLKAFAELERFGRKLCAVRQLQSWFRMIKRRRLFVNLRNKAVRIQRAWRSYQRDKNWSMKFTSHWFSGEGSALEKEQVHWRNLLHRALHDKIISAQEGVEGVLSRNEKVLQDKIGLFYYLLDF